MLCLVGAYLFRGINRLISGAYEVGHPAQPLLFLRSLSHAVQRDAAAKSCLYDERWPGLLKKGGSGFRQGCQGGPLVTQLCLPDSADCSDTVYQFVCGSDAFSFVILTADSSNLTSSDDL